MHLERARHSQHLIKQLTGVLCCALARVLGPQDPAVI